MERFLLFAVDPLFSQMLLPFYLARPLLTLSLPLGWGSTIIVIYMYEQQSVDC